MIRHVGIKYLLLFFFFLHYFFGSYLIYTLNTTFYDLGILYYKINNIDSIYQIVSFRPINYFFYYLNSLISENITFIFIFLNAIAIILPAIFFYQKNKIDYYFLFFYFSIPVFFFSTKNLFHSEIFFPFLLITNLYFKEKNIFFFYISLFLIFLVKDILLYIHCFFLLILHLRKNKIPEKIFKYLNAKKNLFIVFSYIFLVLVVILINKNKIQIIYLSLLFFYLSLYVKLLKIENILLLFFLSILLPMSAFNNVQIFSLKNHNLIIFISYILFFIFQNFHKIKKKNLIYCGIFNIILLLVLNPFYNINNYKTEELSKIKKEINKINKSSNKIIVQNSINFYPKTDSYEVLNLKNLKKLNSDPSNTYVILNIKNFFIDDKKCNFDKDVCYKNKFEKYEIKPRSILKLLEEKNFKIQYSESDFLILMHLSK